MIAAEVSDLEKNLGTKSRDTESRRRKVIIISKGIDFPDQIIVATGKRKNGGVFVDIDIENFVDFSSGIFVLVTFKKSISYFRAELDERRGAVSTDVKCVKLAFALRGNSIFCLIETEKRVRNNMLLFWFVTEFEISESLYIFGNPNKSQIQFDD